MLFVFIHFCKAFRTPIVQMRVILAPLFFVRIQVCLWAKMAVYSSPTCLLHENQLVSCISAYSFIDVHLDGGTPFADLSFVRVRLVPAFF